MPHFDSNTPPGAHGPPVETGAIGAAIDDEGPSKTQQFFTDPKNLATMLVLASALAQPRRQGRSSLAHALRAGTGALAFRGSVEQGIHEQRQTDLEQQGVAEARVAKIASDQGTINAANRRTGAQALAAREGIESAESISEAEIAAGKYEKAPPAAGTFLEKAMLQAQKEYSDAYLSWVSLGSRGAQPKYEEYILRAMQTAAMGGFGVEGQVSFEPTPIQPDAADAVTIPGGVPTTAAEKKAAAVAEREAKRKVITTNRQVTQLRQVAKAAEGGFGKTPRALALGSPQAARAIEGMTDEEIGSLIEQKTAEGEALAASGTVEQIAEFLRDNKLLIAKETLKKLERELRRK